MNKLIIIANGFDLIHHLKTDDISFFNWDVSNNFDGITRNISRHLKINVKMRNRVFNKTMCYKIPKSE